MNNKVHTCHANGCEIEVPPRKFMCRRHWFMVPKELRFQIWLHYEPGQEIRKDPTEEYLKVADLAIEEVAKRETR